MALRFVITREARPEIKASPKKDGYLILTVDPRGVAKFSRLDDGGSLDVGEIRMLYRQRHKEIKFATNAFFFQEGKASLYEAAKYGEFKVAANGDSILVAMRDAKFQILGESISIAE